ncbi:RicAFT regulatory complex protein RicA family protein [Vagococcus allomyrinae]|nr:YlbF family regulator [Vagococcus allomyrinae]
MEREEFAMDDEVQRALDHLLAMLDKSEIIQEYKKIEAKVQDHQGLVAMTDEIKEYQKQAVKFAHYGKPEAEKQAIKKADELTAAFDDHPLVIRYREKLIEANDLLQHLTHLLESQVNLQLALTYEDLWKPSELKD